MPAARRWSAAAGPCLGPYYYLPKLESHLEARLWNDAFVFGQETLGIPVGTIRATVLIETIWAAFEMEEILYELREHSAGLNAGRWDYIFSIIKAYRERPDMVLPDRGQVTMAVPFMRAYAQALVRACHRHGAHAIGGMSAFIPNRREPEVTASALAAGARGQGARGRRRLRRHLGGASRPRAGGHGGLRRASSGESAQPDASTSARTPSRPRRS